jgi:transposase InsO family protein
MHRMAIPTTKNLYLKFNNYFQTDEDIDNVIEKLKIPNKNDKLFNFKYRGFQIKNDKLFYTPNNLEVIKHTNLEKVLSEEYKKIPATGITNFYKTIRLKYLNIKRSDVEEFLKKDATHQLMGDIKHRTNKPIVAKYNNELWCADLIDLSSYESKNKKFCYILNVVDVFSRRIFLEGLKTKSSEACRDAFEKIVRKANVNPSYLITDNGGEFKKDFQEFCSERDIKQRLNRAYAPQANGIVERANKEVVKIIHSYFIKNKNNHWIEHLDDIEKNKNDTYTRAIQNTPINIWDNTKEESNYRIGSREAWFSRNPKEEQKINAKNVILKNVKKQIEEFKDNELEVGDNVRIRMDEISKNIKKMVKEGNKKKIIITYTPLIFTIVKKIIPRSGLLERCQYICSYHGRIVLTKIDGRPRRFYANVLQKVGKNEQDVALTIKDAIKLSGETENQNDAYFEIV